MTKELIVNRYTIGIAIVILTIALFMGIGMLVMEGENPISIGATIWHLGDRDILLRIANDKERYLMIDSEDWQERLAQNLDRIEGIKGITGVDWLLDNHDGNKLVYNQVNKNDRNEQEVTYEYYKETYIIVTYSSLSQ